MLSTDVIFFYAQFEEVCNIEYKQFITENCLVLSHLPGLDHSEC